MKAPKRLSVLMPVFNAEKYLKEAIDSILNQSYSDFDFLIINDGSTDSSEEIILGYSDSRIIYVKNEFNIGLIDTLNKGLSLVTTEIIARMDADDYSFPDRFEKQLQLLDENPIVGIVGLQFITYTSDVATSYGIDQTEILYRMFYQCPFVHAGIMFRRKNIDSTQLKYNKEYTHAEDYELYSRLCLNTPSKNHSETLMKIRFHYESVSYTEQSTQIDNSIRVKKNYYQFWGVSFSNDEISLLNKFFYKEFSYFSEKNQLLHCQELVHRLVNAILEKGNLELAEKIKDTWFHLCYNLASSRVTYNFWKKSNLNTPISWKHIVFWNVKSFLK